MCRNVRGYDLSAGGKPVGQRQPKRLVLTSRCDYACLPIQCGKLLVGDSTCKANCHARTCADGELLESLAIWAITNDDELGA